MENILNWEYISLIPPLLTLVLVVLTRKVGISLGVGIITSAFVVAGAGILETLGIIWSSFAMIFIDDGAINTWNAFILIFLSLLGIMTAFINMSGGAKAFTAWALTKVKSRRGANFATALLGIIVFIDDYFSALIVGQVAKPLTDKYNVSRAKLAYLIDTTASPVSVIAPISSWGAGIMGLVAPLLTAAGLVAISPFQAFVYMIPMNFYVLTAIAMMFIVIATRFDIGPMRKHEALALNEGRVVENPREVPGETDEELPVHQDGSAKALIIPILGLALTVITAMFITGAMTGGSVDIFSIFENTLVTHSLVIGGIVGLALSLFYFFKDTRHDNDFGRSEIWLGVKTGFMAMFPAILVLTLAWMIGDLIGQLGTGELLGAMVERSSLPTGALLAVVFAVACLMALATGTSWGSFGILIPITGEIMISLGETDLLLPSIAAVLAGAVFGDHCSPISDSTILSSTGAGCNHIVHVMTQLPYAVGSALIALVGYLVLGLTSSLLLSLGVLLVLIILVFIIAKVVYTPIARRNAQS
ncbi:Na+/H+ antiporter NhaC family protein [Salinicoccus hispanicus]|uniref:Na+/H+ antiporter NhaC family protein n=1 Tax=Salinicoccus hispanicus TaxID=157225 RepID=A0A6N8U3M7_9STAP|nr:Na+/H+ antiporter NhaC family protein [Salinicoccus hispanicus]MXQ50801.1 Na+/H+ antiporter NhaC family protein [Salinicoccus hispanicus]